MKKFGSLLLLVSLGLFTVGCAKEEPAPAPAPSTDSMEKEATPDAAAPDAAAPEEPAPAAN